MSVAIRTSGLTKAYRRAIALDNVSLEVPAGIVFGYLGPNGAGKTTTIRILAGLLRPTSGTATILGTDVLADREGAQRHVGYLPGDFVAYADLTAEQYLRYLGNLRGGVPPARARGLAERLRLDLRSRIGEMSHGNRQKVGIIQAFHHQPEVLILDEPTAGLDPLVQREFLGMVREARDEGRTVFLSSHVMSEVEAVADTVGILRRGALIEVADVATLKSQALRRIDMVLDEAVSLEQLRLIDGVREATCDHAGTHVLVEGSTAPLLSCAAPYGISSIITHEPDLEEIFLGYYAKAV
ncbi:ABC transporter ATP-binding protein [Lolliginicoccus levis]|uniref:ABC transporter ATP-binding protein n=1 Tax=Lolliginicoccus levis TaxID=2919542 RepID=UPI00241FDFD7|nr:ABC transporter ATP-binding protein [Lolliginicoccus levis]